MRRRSAAAIPLRLLQFTTGCASARLTQFHNFAQAGTAYVKASHSVLYEAGIAFIRTDSFIAVKGTFEEQTLLCNQAVGWVARRILDGL
jgi:hypothetical protein